MYLLIVFLHLLGSVAGTFFLLGSEGSARMPTGTNFCIFGILLLSLLLLLSFICHKYHKKFRFILFVIQMICILVVSFFFFLIRIKIGLCLSSLLSSILIYKASGGEINPYSSPSNASSEDSFGLRVLSEPWPVTPDLGLESSMRNRIRILEDSNSPFLLGKERGIYWGEIKESLENAPSQKEYFRILDFESRDLQIREKKHSSYEVFRRVLLQNPFFEEAASYSPHEAFCDFVSERRDALEASHPGHSPAEVDRLEIVFLNQVQKDLLRRGIKSVYINQIL